MYQKANVEGYAYALFELAKENNELEQTYTLFASFHNAVREHKPFLQLLANPALDNETKFSFIDQTFASLTTSDLITNFFKVLIERKSVGLYSRITKHFFTLVEKHQGVKRAKIYTSFALDQARKDKFKNYLQAKYNCKINLVSIIKPELLAGFRIEVDSDVIEQNNALDLDKLAKLISRKEA
ncbi:ATP synthase F1 subunit delta [Mycoplasma simbae]|uniref:ATP synthase F1 subunit delta n=1 Tax=Mycoplasma simbae TaxID=36744 RepID=UPI0004966AFD|nr:ATP synthase F1 subunit delta [Mycoplasma simbae]